MSEMYSAALGSVIKSTDLNGVNAFMSVTELHTYFMMDQINIQLP